VVVSSKVLTGGKLQSVGLCGLGTVALLGAL